MPCSPGMVSCRVGCLHRARIEDYRRERDAQAARCEAIAGYPPADHDRPEVRAFFGDPREPKADHVEDRVLFRDWLIATKTPAQERSEGPAA